MDQEVNAGLAYEKRVRACIASAARNIPRFSVSMIASGGNDRRTADLYFNVQGTRFGLECKQNAHAQMGQPARVRYDGRAFKLEDATGQGSMDAPTRNAVSAALRDRKSEVDNLLEFLRRQAPRSFHAEYVEGVPFMCTQDAWESARDKGLLRAVNSSVRRTADVVAKYYAAKGTCYIQVGGLGLFHLGENPLSLPVPMLRGEVNVELRVKSGGAKLRKTSGLVVTDGSLSAIARLVTRERSPWSLDKPEHVAVLFSR